MKKLEQFLETLQSYAANSWMEGDGGTYIYAHLLEEVERWHCRLDSRPSLNKPRFGLESCF